MEVGSADPVLLGDSLPISVGVLDSASLGVTLDSGEELGSMLISIVGSPLLMTVGTLDGVALREKLGSMLAFRGGFALAPTVGTLD